MYQEIQPSEILKNTIDSFWTFSNNKTGENFKVLPDTCTDLIFDLNQNKGFLSGAMTTYQHRKLTTESNLIGVRFRTEKFGSLSKIPLNETKNLRVELSQIFTADSINKINQLNALETTKERVYFLENFITTCFKENKQKQDLLVLMIAQNIRFLKGNLKVKELATSNHINIRQLERRFKNFMGLTLKEFSNIVRFNTAKKSIAIFSKTSLLEIALDLGFFDHSHMTYEFKRVSGEMPSFFR